MAVWYGIAIPVRTCIYASRKFWQILIKLPNLHVIPHQIFRLYSNNILYGQWGARRFPTPEVDFPRYYIIIVGRDGNFPLSSPSRAHTHTHTHNHIVTTLRSDQAHYWNNSCPILAAEHGNLLWHARTGPSPNEPGHGSWVSDVGEREHPRRAKAAAGTPSGRGGGGGERGRLVPQLHQSVVLKRRRKKNFILKKFVG